MTTQLRTQSAWNHTVVGHLAAVLIVVALTGCKDRSDGESQKAAVPEVQELASVPQVPATPTFEEGPPDPTPKEDPAPEEGGGRAESVGAAVVSVLVAKARPLPAPTYQRVNTYAQMGTLEGHRGAVLSLHVVGAEPFVVTSGMDATIRFWEIAKGEATKTIKDTFAQRVLVSDDGTMVLAENQGATRVIDARSGTVAGTLRLAGLMALSHDGKKVLAQRSPDVVDVVDVATGERLHEVRGHKRKVQCALFSADDRQIVTGGDATDQTVRIWDASSGTLSARLQDPHMSEALSVSMSPDGKILAAVEFTKITIWDVAAKKIVRQIENLPHDYPGFAGYKRAEFLDGEGSRLAVTQDHLLGIVDVRTGTVLQTLKAHDGPIGVIGVSRDGAFIVTGTSAMGGSGEPCKVWGSAARSDSPLTQSGIPVPLSIELVSTINEQRGGVGPLVCSADGNILYSGTATGVFADAPGGMVNAYDPRSARLLRSYDSQIPRRVSLATRLALSPDGKLLAMGTNQGDIVVWEAATGRELASSEAYSKEIEGLSFLARGTGLLVGVHNEQVFPILDPMTGQEIRRLTVIGAGPKGLRVLQDGSGVLIGDTLRQLDDGGMVRRFESRLRNTYSSGLGVSSDGIVVAGVAPAQGGTELRVWNSGYDAPTMSKRIGEAEDILLIRVSTAGHYVATVHQSGITLVLKIRDTKTLVEVAAIGLDGYAAVADVLVDESSKTIAVSGSAHDGLLRFFRW